MATAGSPKKSETIEVRLSHAAKTAFMQRCRDEARTASDAVRGFIEGELEDRAPPARARRPGLWQAVVAAVVGLAVGAIAAPSLAQPIGASRAAFERLDRNHDGVLSFGEFRGR